MLKKRTHQTDSKTRLYVDYMNLYHRPKSSVNSVHALVFVQGVPVPQIVHAVDMLVL